MRKASLEFSCFVESFDMGCPSVCCEYVLLPLVDKEAALSYGRAEYSKLGNSSRDTGERRWSHADAMWLLKEKDTRILPVNNESRGKM